jgi:hypothetical protein
MNEKDLRDCFAMFAMMGLVINENRSAVPEMAYQLADAMLEARNKEPEQEVGIVAVKRTLKKEK